MYTVKVFELKDLIPGSFYSIDRKSNHKLQFIELNSKGRPMFMGCVGPFESLYDKYYE